MHTCTLPQIRADRLNALGEDIYYQDIDNAHSTEVNIDYYSVEITQMPDFNDDGHPDNQVEFMDAIKANILSLASGSQNGFQSNCPNGGTPDIWWSFEDYPGMYPSSSTQWSGSDPLGTIFFIDAGGEVLEILYG